MKPTSPLSMTHTVATNFTLDTDAEMLKLDRKRSQDRLHQRRHRAKRKMQLSTLEQDVKDLKSTVAALGAKRQRLSCSTNNNNSSSSSNNSNTVQQQRSVHALEVVRAYFDVFKYGHSAIHAQAQESFLRTTLTADVVGVDVSGVDAFANQWRLYGGFFWSTLLEATAMRVKESTGDDTVVVDVTAELHLRLRADLATLLCPQLVHEPALLQTIVDNVISVNATYTFVVETDGRVSQLLTQIDFVSALYRVLGSLATVAQVVDGAQINMCSGTITCALPGVTSVAMAVAPKAVLAKANKVQPMGALNYRLQLDFLLSASS